MDPQWLADAGPRGWLTRLPDQRVRGPVIVLRQKPLDVPQEMGPPGAGVGPAAPAT